MSIIWNGAGPRKEAGLSQAELAHRLGVGLRTIQRWEATTGPIEAAQAYADALGCSLGDLGPNYRLDPAKVRECLTGLGDDMSEEEWLLLAADLR